MEQRPDAATLPRPLGDRCSFPRTLTRGTYGGDVNCLQQHLWHTGFLSEEEPTGYFGALTEAALKKWQAANGVDRGAGIFALSSRAAYAQRHGLPAPDSGVVFADGADTADEAGKTCIDVCAEFAGQQDCQTRCVRTAADKKHACQEACQTAFSTACDRAFPPTAEGGSQNYQVCLQYLDGSCADTCASFR